MRTVLLLEGEGAEFVEDPLRFAYLEVWTDVGSMPPASASTMVGVPAMSTTADAGERPSSRILQQS